jgi:hypothetical protein
MEENRKKCRAVLAKILGKVSKIEGKGIFLGK